MKLKSFKELEYTKEFIGDPPIESIEKGRKPCPYYPDGVHLWSWNTSLWYKDMKYEKCKCGATGKIAND